MEERGRVMDYGLAGVVVALSSLARTGWMLRGVPPNLAETVANHSFTAALIALDMSLKLSRKGLRVDAYRAAAITLVHDLAEAVIGDIPKTGLGFLEESKERAELEAFKSTPLSDLSTLFEEYEDGSTLEAIVARKPSPVLGMSPITASARSWTRVIAAAL
jgi:putative hydrolase of HD superfamily